MLYFTLDCDILCSEEVFCLLSYFCITYTKIRLLGLYLMFCWDSWLFMFVVKRSNVTYVSSLVYTSDSMPIRVPPRVHEPCNFHRNRNDHQLPR